MPLFSYDFARRTKAAVEAVEAILLPPSSNAQASSGNSVYQSFFKVRITDEEPLTAPSGAVYYRAWTQIENPEVSEWIDFVQCYVTDPNQKELDPGICVAQESGNYFGFPVFVAMFTGLTIRTILTTIEGPPPWEIPDDVKCNQKYTDGTYEGTFNCGTNLFTYFCPCDPFSPGSNPGSGSTGGIDPGCDCPQCPNGLPGAWGVEIGSATGDFAGFVGVWDGLDYVSVCNFHQEEGDAVFDLDYDSSDGKWHLILTDGASGSFWEYINKDPWNCCSDNYMIYHDSTPDAGVVTDFLVLSPLGPCSPCSGGGGGGGGIVVGCCPGLGLTSTLHGTTSAGTGTCTCVNSVPEFALNNELVLGVPSQKWVSGAVTICGASNVFTVECLSGGWRASISGPTPGGLSSLSILPTSVNCTSLGSFELVFDFTGYLNPPNGCNGGFRFTVII